MQTFPDIDGFYAADERRRFSGESDYGVWWRDRAGGQWRASYVHATGDLYVICIGRPRAREVDIGGQAVILVGAPPGHEGPVLQLGTLAPTPPDHRHYDRLADAPAEAALRGWVEACGQPGSLDWLRARVAEAITAVGSVDKA